MSSSGNTGSGSGLNEAEVGSTSAEQSAGTGFGSLIDSLDSSYSSGGKGGSGSKGSGGNNARGLSLGAGGGNSANFGAGGNGEEVTMLGQDPDDYFTRINLEDSIFKLVRKRYQTKEKIFLLGL